VKSPAGAGTSAGDGYFLMIKLLQSGTHAFNYSGSFSFAIIEGDPFDQDAAMDMNYYLTVQ
jgi:hypothetical protein